MKEDSLQDQPSSLEARLISELMAEHGITSAGDRYHALEQILDIRYSPARRRMLGEVPWTLEELEKTAQHFGETLLSLFSRRTASGFIPASLVVAGVNVPCSIVTSTDARVGRAGPLVAVQAAEGAWRVVLAQDIAAVPSHELLRLVISSTPKPKWRVAVVDDDADLATALADYLSTSGLEGTAFFSFATFARAAESRLFDAYVFDWLIGRETARDSIIKIRGANANSPIAVVTGQIEKGNVVESELASFAATYKLLIVDKPARASSVLSLLSVALEGVSAPA